MTMSNTSSTQPTVALIGTGNMSWQLVRVFNIAGISVMGVYGRDIEKVRAFCLDFEGVSALGMDDLFHCPADLIFACVSDQSIPELSASIFPKNALLIHTSGTVPLTQLPHDLRTGVFYPLQTFTKGKIVDFQKIPILLESKYPADFAVLHQLASLLSSHVLAADSAQRMRVHLAAVLACNFTNYLYTLASDVLEENHMEFRLLQPLIRETMEKAFSIGPKQGQTGPARRGDAPTIARHLGLLKENPLCQEVYQLLTKGIVARYQSDR
jgi:predicted short-subunit dehydrogenase-like oxidoreductase (DUF2520 family)